MTPINVETSSVATGRWASLARRRGYRGLFLFETVTVIVI